MFRREVLSTVITDVEFCKITVFPRIGSTTGNTHHTIRNRIFQCTFRIQQLGLLVEQEQCTDTMIVIERPVIIQGSFQVSFLITTCFLCITQHVTSFINTLQNGLSVHIVRNTGIQEVISRLCTVLMYMYLIVHVERVHGSQFQPFSKHIQILCDT